MDPRRTYGAAHLARGNPEGYGTLRPAIGAMSSGAGVGSVWISAGAPGTDEEGIVSVLEIVGSYYDAWISGKGDFSAVPLAPDFAFTGPVASFDSADGFWAM